MQKIDQITGTGIPLLLDDIDTDRIIPARYLRFVSRLKGWGAQCLRRRSIADAQSPLRRSAFRRAQPVLVVGRNFGCGSSRASTRLEALMRWGVKAIVGESFAEIFLRQLHVGQWHPCGVRLPRKILKKLAAAIEKSPREQLTVDLLAGTVQIGGFKCPCTLHQWARGRHWSRETGISSVSLWKQKEQIRATADRLPYVRNFA